MGFLEGLRGDVPDASLVDHARALLCLLHRVPTVVKASVLPAVLALFVHFANRFHWPVCLAGGVVLDPFGGAGTTGLVSDRHGRDAILIELNPEYAAMANNRIFNDAPLFADVA